MSKYTTGEIAKLCGVSVRTVQYYDNRGILTPSELSEGGRRLYTDHDLKQMQIICFLREAGFSINSISALLAEEHPENIITLLLDEQQQMLTDEMTELQTKLGMIEELRRNIRKLDDFSVESIGDIALVMKQKKKLFKMRFLMVLTGILVSVLQLTAIILWITHGLWWLFVIWAFVAIPWGICLSKYYFDHVAYICPQCHKIFKPTLKEVFWAYHTPRMRRLTCPKCAYNGLCVEVYNEKRREDIDV